MHYIQVSYSAYRYTSIYYEQRNTGDACHDFGLYKSFGVRLCTLFTS